MIYKHVDGCLDYHWTSAAFPRKARERCGPQPEISLPVASAQQSPIQTNFQEHHRDPRPSFFQLRLWTAYAQPLNRNGLLKLTPLLCHSGKICQKSESKCCHGMNAAAGPQQGAPDLGGILGWDTPSCGWCAGRATSHSAGASCSTEETQQGWQGIQTPRLNYGHRKWQV